MRHRQGRRLLGPTVCLAGALVLLLPVSGPAENDARTAHGRHRHPGGFPHDPFQAIQDQLDDISAQLDALYVPFKVQIPGGLCNSMTAGSANPKILIDSDGSDPFTLGSVLIKRAPQNPVDFTFLTVNGVTINGTFFETRTGNLFDPLFGEFAVQQGADIMGMPVRRGGSIDDAKPGGNVPHLIVAEADGSPDVSFTLFCRSDNQDLEIEAILVAGWKKPADAISVTYVPGD